MVFCGPTVLFVREWEYLPSQMVICFCRWLLCIWGPVALSLLITPVISTLPTQLEGWEGRQGWGQWKEWAGEDSSRQELILRGPGARQRRLVSIRGMSGCEWGWEGGRLDQKTSGKARSGLERTEKPRAYQTRFFFFFFNVMDKFHFLSLTRDSFPLPFLDRKGNENKCTQSSFYI